MRILAALAALLACLALPQPSLGQAGVAGVVFLDANGDGARQPGEPGLAGVAVSNQIDVATTDAAGSYRLESAGLGVVFVSVPRGHRPVRRFWAPAAAAVDFALAPVDAAERFSFLHASDTHASLDSRARFDLLRAVVLGERPALVLVSGDLVKDALRVGEAEARGYYELYIRETGALGVPVWSAPGNHEVFGIERHHSLVSAKHPLYAKGMYRAYLGPNYYSFDHGRVHFVALDTVGVADLWYHGHVDDAQLAWLEKDLARLPPDAPVVTFNHIPLASARLGAAGYTDDGPAPTLLRKGGESVYRHVVSNAAEVLRRLSARRHVLALGGHYHAYERLELKPGGTRFHQTAAVVAPTPAGAFPSASGVTLYRVDGDRIDHGRFLDLDAYRVGR